MASKCDTCPHEPHVGVCGKWKDMGERGSLGSPSCGCQGTKKETRKFQPARDLLLVEKVADVEGEIQCGLIFMPVTSTMFATYKVLGVGPTFEAKSGMALKSGDIIIAHKDTGHSLFGGTLMGVNDVYGKIEK